MDLRATMSQPPKLQILHEAFSCAHCVYLVIFQNAPSHISMCVCNSSFLRLVKHCYPKLCVSGRLVVEFLEQRLSTPICCIIPVVTPALCAAVAVAPLTE